MSQDKKLKLPEHVEKEREKEVVFDKYSAAMQQAFGMYVNNMRELVWHDKKFVEEVVAFVGAQLAAFSKNMMPRDEDRVKFHEIVRMVADKIVESEEE